MKVRFFIPSNLFVPPSFPLEISNTVCYKYINNNINIAFLRNGSKIKISHPFSDKNWEWNIKNGLAKEITEEEAALIIG